MDSNTLVLDERDDRNDVEQNDLFTPRPLNLNKSHKVPVQHNQREVFIGLPPGMLDSPFADVSCKDGEIIITPVLDKAVAKPWSLKEERVEIMNQAGEPGGGYEDWRAVPVPADMMLASDELVARRKGHQVVISAASGLVEQRPGAWQRLSLLRKRTLIAVVLLSMLALLWGLGMALDKGSIKPLMKISIAVTMLALPGMLLLWFRGTGNLLLFRRVLARLGSALLRGLMLMRSGLLWLIPAICIIGLVIGAGVTLFGGSQKAAMAFAFAPLLYLTVPYLLIRFYKESFIVLISILGSLAEAPASRRNNRHSSNTGLSGVSSGLNGVSGAHDPMFESFIDHDDYKQGY